MGLQRGVPDELPHSRPAPQTCPLGTDAERRRNAPTADTLHASAVHFMTEPANVGSWDEQKICSGATMSSAQGSPHEVPCFAFSHATAWLALAAAVKIALESSFRSCSQLAMYWA